MEPTEALDRIAMARSGHLATVRPDGHPHLVVVTFAVVGDSVVTAIDHKPKTTERLQRLINVEANPTASFLVDHYDDDWARLWWVRVDGPATIHREGPAWESATAALGAKYAPYRDRPPEGPVIAISPGHVVSWSSNG